MKPAGPSHSKGSENNKSENEDRQHSSYRNFYLCMKLYKYILYIIVFLIFFLILQLIESLLPHYWPWLTLGFSNIVILVGLVTAGRKFVMGITVSGIVLSSFILGRFPSPFFYLSISRGLIYCLILIIAYRPLGSLNLIGVSILAGLGQNLTLLAVALILIKYQGIIYILPVLLVESLVIGLINGILVLKIVPRISKVSIIKIYLASSSARRIKILKDAGLPVIVIKHGVKEDKPREKEEPIEFSLRQAKKKLRASYVNLSPPGCLISADTIVEIDGKIFGKPANSQEAQYMLETLSGRIQKVHTAVIARNLKTGKQYERVETTALKMKTLTHKEINLVKNKHLDKAGGYAIQDRGDKYIEWIKGSYTNVVGFPVEIVRELLKKIC